MDPEGEPPERNRLETLSAALAQARADGFEADFTAIEGGMLRCEHCGKLMDPATVRIISRQRFEGETNPDDMDLLLLLQCDCGCRGVFTSAFGPNATAENAEVLRALAGREPEDDADEPGSG